MFYIIQLLAHLMRCSSSCKNRVFRFYAASHLKLNVICAAKTNILRGKHCPRFVENESEGEANREKERTRGGRRKRDFICGCLCAYVCIIEILLTLCLPNACLMLIACLRAGS